MEKKKSYKNQNCVYVWVVALSQMAWSRGPGSRLAQLLKTYDLNRGT